MFIPHEKKKKTICGMVYYCFTNIIYIHDS